MATHKNISVNISAKSHPELSAKIRLNAAEQLMNAANDGYIGQNGTMIDKCEAKRQYQIAKDELENLWLAELKEGIK